MDPPGALGHHADGGVGGDLTGSHDDDWVSPARVEAAEALRRLGHAFVGHDITEDLLRRIAASASAIIPEITSGRPRARDIAYLKRHVFDQQPREGETLDHFPDCVVSGAANPMGIGIKVHRDGHDAVARVTLGHAFEGAPQRAHGGIVAAIFDDVAGFVMNMQARPAYTGRLAVSYLAPTPVGEELEFRARLVGRERRKYTVEGEAYAQHKRITAMEALFIAIPPERLGLPPVEDVEER